MQNENRKEKFTYHYKYNLFKGRHSRSGPGSDPEQTRTLKIELIKLCKELGIKRLLDVPCGDCFWIRDIWKALDLDMYIGMDIVEEMIQSNKSHYEIENRKFLTCDLVEASSIPSVDMILCRDCLVHLSFDSSKKILKNLANSDIKYFLLTTFTNENRINHDSDDGTNWYPMNLMKEPFNLPTPKLLLNEKCTEGNGNYGDKCLGLWTREELQQSVESY